MLISARNISKGFLGDVILRGVSLEVHENDRIGLLGVNGAGKTTLLNILAGLLEADEGEMVRAKNLEIGYLRQNDALSGHRTLNEEARDAFTKVYRLKEKLDACSQKLAQTPHSAALLAEYDSLLARFEAKDGYTLGAKVDRVLNGLGFGGFDRAARVETLSGGEKMRFAFAKMLLREPDLLLLDEPTNHLDFTMLAWLEDYLQSYKGAVLVVSHDRYFLDAIARDVCEVERGGLTRYPGGYTSFVQQKANARKTAQRAYDRQQEEIAKLEDYVRRNLVRASTTKMAQSRRSALEKMERLAPPPADKSISLRFDYDVEPFRQILECKNLSVSVGEGTSARQLYAGLNLTVQRGEKLALVGLNGVGKSTFLKALQGLVPHGGSARWGGNVRLGYFDQELAGLPMDASVLEAVHSCYTAKTEYEIRSALGRLLLGGETVHKKVRELSGAMRAKVAFAILQMRRANVLLLDEPTNHLDYQAKEALEEALDAFDGTLLAVSHDRYFLSRVPTAILEMTAEGFVRIEGNFDAYRAAGGAAAKPPAPGPAPAGPAASAAPTAAKQGADSYRTKQQRAADAQRRTAIAGLEKEIARLEAAIQATHTALAARENAGDYQRLAELSESLKADTAALDAVMEEWIGLTEDT